MNDYEKVNKMMKNSNPIVKRFPLKLKLIVIFVSIAAVAVILSAFATFQKSQKALETEAFRKLTAIREMKARQLEGYFHLIEGQIRLLSEDDTVSFAIQQFSHGMKFFGKSIFDDNVLRERVRSYYEKEVIPRINKNQDSVTARHILPTTKAGLALQNSYIINNPHDIGEKDAFNGTVNENPYEITHRKHHHFFRDFIKEFGYYDLFLINLDGEIVYSVFKEIDLGTSLVNGPYKSTNFAAVFRKAMQTNREKVVFFSDFEPYTPSYNTPAAFVTAPVYNHGEKMGVIALQFPVNRINEIMTDGYNWKNVGLGDSGETYLVGPDFRLRNQSRFLIETPEEFFSQIKQIDTTKESALSIHELNTTVGLLPIKTKGTMAALKGEAGTEVFADYRGVPVLSSYRLLDLHDLNWAIMSEIDTAEAFSSITNLRKTAFLITLVIVAIVIVIAIFTAGSITKPLIALANFSKDLANIDFRKDETEQLIESIRSIMNRGDEVGDLANDFANLSTNLKDSVRNLISVETEKERMSGELKIAANIQRSMLPLTFPKFPEHMDIDVWATLRPAREVGGDFYDFFFIDEKYFCFVIADVSGKGAPAALLMAVTKTLIKANTQDILSPSIIIERINNELSENNDDCMFVTLFFGILDTETGLMTYTNAGHNPPYLYKNSWDLSILSEVHGPMIGVMPGIKYEQEEIQLNIDSKLILYTDGVTEAFNNSKEPYGEERLLEFIKQTGDLGPKYIASGILEAVDKFTEGAEQSDDITVFCLRYVAWKCRKDAANVYLYLKNEFKEIDRTLNAFATFCQKAGLKDEIQHSVSIVLDDLLNNIISYAFEDSGDHEIEVLFRSEKHRLIINVSDDGVEFDPFLLQNPDTESDIDKRGIGGLGIHMIKSIMDDCFYKRKNGRNKITLVKRIDD